MAFSSDADNLVPGDTNNSRDTFIHDRITGQTTRIPDYSGGVISADGLFVVSAGGGVFVHERVSGKTKRVDLSTEGHNGNQARGRDPAISADGRYVSFNSNSSNLVSGVSGAINTFVRDRHLNRFQTADLQLAVTSQPASVKRDQLAHYVFTVSNNGPDSDEGGVKLIDIVSKGKVWSLSPSQGTCIIAAVSVCRFGTLAAGESATLTAVYKATGGNPMTQQVSVNAAPVDSEPANNSLTVSTPVTP